MKKRLEKDFKKGKVIVCVILAVATFMCSMFSVSHAAKVTLNHKSITLTKGESKVLKVKGSKQKVKWSSSKPTVVSVKNGKITAKKKGNAVITAKVGENKKSGYKKLTCKVKVKDENPVSAEPVTPNPIENKYNQEKFSNGVNHFSYGIFEKLERGDNLFISPYSMAVMLSMLDNGAKGQTREEIENLLGIEDLSAWNQYAEQYMASERGEDTKLLTGNAIWMSDRIRLSEHVQEDFFTPLKQYYDAETKTMDLSTEKAKNDINQWVAKKTENMIVPFLTENLRKDVRMVLLNTVYFEGKWKTVFDLDDTKQQNFYGKNGTVKTDMMHMYQEQYKYTVKHGIRCIEIPYRSGDAAMDILMPEDEEKNIQTVFGGLSEGQKNEVFEGIDKAEKTQIAELALPKFEFTYGTEDVSDALKAMGMTTAFDGEKADFTTIGYDLYLSEVLHKAKIEVGEEGTKAAGATAAVMKDTCAIMQPQEEKLSFIADKPFIAVIRDTKTGVILFMGEIQDLGESLKDIGNRSN